MQAPARRDARAGRGLGQGRQTGGGAPEVLCITGGAVGFGLLVFVAAVGGAAFWLWRKKTDCDAKYRKAQDIAQAALEFSIDIYRATVAEFVDAKIAFGEEDAKESDLLLLIDTWPTFVQQHKEEQVS